MVSSFRPLAILSFLFLISLTLTQGSLLAYLNQTLLLPNNPVKSCILPCPPHVDTVFTCRCWLLELSWGIAV